MKKIKGLNSSSTPEVAQRTFITSIASLGASLDTRKPTLSNRYSFDKYLKAFQLYMTHDHTNKEIAQLCLISVNHVRKWINKNNWKDRREELERSVVIELEEQTKALMARARPTMIAKQLEICAETNDRIMRHVQQVDIGTKGLSEVTSAHKNNAEISHKILGIGNDENNGSTVNVLIQPGLKGNIVNAAPMAPVIEPLAGGPVYKQEDTEPEPPEVASF